MNVPDLPDLDQIADAAEDAARVSNAAGSIFRKMLKVGRLFRGQKADAAGPPAADPGVEMGPVGNEPTAPRTVVMFGPGGVGKTTFGRFVESGTVLPVEPPGKYVEDLKIARFRSPSGAEAEYLVPPGQERRRPRDWDDLLARLGDGEFCGVVIFASYGYHSLAQAGGYKAHTLYDGNRKEFLSAYLEAKRLEEIAVAKLVGKAVRRSPEPVWILTCVTKQDLWWRDKAHSNEFYEVGAYADALTSSLEGCDPSLLRRETSYCCLAIQNLRDAHRDIIAEHDPKYDEVKKAESLAALLERLEALLEGGEE